MERKLNNWMAMAFLGVFTLLATSAQGVKPWEQYTYEAAGFKNSFPTEPKMEFVEGKKGARDAYQATCVQESYKFKLSATVVRVCEEIPPVDEYFAELTAKGRVAAQESFTVSGFQGIEARFVTEDGVHTNYRVVIAQNRIYECFIESKSYYNTTNLRKWYNYYELMPFPETWEDKNYNDYGFKMMFPVAPEDPKTEEHDDGTKTHKFVAKACNNVTFSVWATEGIKAKGSIAEETLKSFVGAGEVESKVDYESGELKGIAAKVVTKKKGHVYYWTFMSGNTLFQVMVIANKEYTDQAWADKFIGSFRPKA